jgi:hypothetical protein
MPVQDALSSDIKWHPLHEEVYPFASATIAMCVLGGGRP